MKRPGQLVRKKGLKPGKPLRKVSKERAAANRRGKRAARETDYLDCQGVAFSQHHLFWKPLMPEVVRNVALMAFMHERFYWCFNCGGVVGSPRIRAIEMHHICNSARSDVRTNIMPLCVRWGEDGCHDIAKSAALPMGRLLWKKVVHDPDGTDWVLLARLLGCERLPDLVTE